MNPAPRGEPSGSVSEPFGPGREVVIVQHAAPPWRGGRSRPDPDIGPLRELAQQLRVDSIRASVAAGDGHPTDALSAAELIAVLVARHLRVDPRSLEDPARDHLIVSAGRAAPILYAALLAIGAIDEDELLDYRQPGSRLQALPAPDVPLVDAATGSLGFGLAVGQGMALAMQRLEPRASRIWLLCGDTELANGSVWEAVEAAGSERLDALTVIVDVSRLGGTGSSRHGGDTLALRRRFEAFDWRVLEIDGHDVRSIDGAYRTASETRFRPAVILARTIRGRGVRRVADQAGLHGRPLIDTDAAIAELGGVRSVRITPPTPLGARARDRRSGGRQVVRLPSWPVGAGVGMSDAVGEALVALGTGRPDLVVLDADVGDGDRLGRFRDVDPQRYFPVFAAEALLAGAAIGFAVRGWTAVAGVAGGVLLRVADIVRMAAAGGTPLRLVGSAAGTGPDGDASPSAGLEDVALLRAIDGSAVLEPSDANQAAALLEAMLDWPGPIYLRVGGEPTTVRTPPGRELRIGGSREVASSPDDRVAVIATGRSVDEAVRAAEILEADRLGVRILDAYSVKPLDAAAVEAAAAAVDGRIVVVEDHRPEGGLGSAVMEALAGWGRPLRLAHLAVRGRAGQSVAGRPSERRAAAGIDAAAIARAVRRLARDGSPPETRSPDAPLQGSSAGEGDGLQRNPTDPERGSARLAQGGSKDPARRKRP
ncbi:MAG: transketolase [Chloroflexi bacterium]|nr:transketolase [Chloroflexota bacterium]